MVNPNKITKQRFDLEVYKWEKYHKKELKSIISYEILKRKEITKNIISNNFSKKSINILEIGCGTGDNLFEIVKSNKLWKGKGVDISSGMIDFCKKKYFKEKKLEFQELNIDKCKLNQKFDVIFLLGVIGYLKSNEKSFLNIMHMLKPKGMLIFTFGNKSSIFRKFRQFYLKWPTFPILGSILNKFRTLITKRKPVVYKKENHSFKPIKEKTLLKQLPKELVSITEFNIVFSSGILGPLSIFSNKILEKIFLKRDPLKLAMTKLIILKKMSKQNE